MKYKSVWLDQRRTFYLTLNNAPIVVAKLHPHADSSAAITIPRAGISFLKAGVSDIQAPVVQKGITPRADTTAALSI